MEWTKKEVEHLAKFYNKYDSTPKETSEEEDYECEFCGKIIFESEIYKDAPMDRSCGYIPTWCNECGARYEIEVE